MGSTNSPPLVERVSYDGSEVLTISLDSRGIEWEQSFLICSDLHLDSKECDWDLVEADFNKAKKNNSIILIIGDICDAMGSRNDKRRTQNSIDSSLRERMERDDCGYLDAIEEHVVDMLKPWASNIYMLSKGNHETAMELHSDRNLLRNICLGLKRHGSPVECMPYEGWVRWQFRIMGFDHPESSRKMLYFHHGREGSGGGEVTQNMIFIERKCAEVDFDLFATGHTHYRHVGLRERLRVDHLGRPVTVTTPIIQSGSYKKYGEWENRRGMKRKPRGGTHGLFQRDGRKIVTTLELTA